MLEQQLDQQQQPEDRTQQLAPAAAPVVTDIPPHTDPATAGAAPVDAQQQQQPPVPTDAQTAKRLEMIARQERQFREREKAVKQQEKELAEARELMQSLQDESKLIDYLDKKKPDVFKTWANKIITEQANQGPQDPASKALTEVQQLRAHIEKLEAERKQQAEAAAWASYVDTTVKEVRALEEKYPLIVAEEAEAEVAEYIRLHYDKSGEVLKVDTAAEMVENYLRERYQKAFARERAKSYLLSTYGAQKPEDTASLQQQQAPAQDAAKKQADRAANGNMKTITTRAASQSALRKPTASNAATHDDAWAEILAKMS